MSNQDTVIILAIAFIWLIIIFALKSAKPTKSYLKESDELERLDSEKEAIRQKEKPTPAHESAQSTEKVKTGSYFLVGFFITGISLIVRFLTAIPRGIIRYIRREWDAAGKEK